LGKKDVLGKTGSVPSKIFLLRQGKASQMHRPIIAFVDGKLVTLHGCTCHGDMVAECIIIIIGKEIITMTKVIQQ